MVDYQTISIILTGIGMVIALTYYALQIRSQNKTRQAQLYLRIWEQWNTKEFSEQRYEAYRMEWTDYDDFQMKYNPINNPEAFASWNTFGRTINGVAELRRKNLIDIEFLDEEMIVDIKRWWTMFGALEREGWKRGSPGWGGHFPFIKEVIDYDRKRRSWLYDEETGEAKPTRMQQYSGQVWVQPEEIEKMRMKLYK